MRFVMIALCLFLVVGSSQGWGFFRHIKRIGGHVLKHAAKHALGHALKYGIGLAFGDEESLLNALKEMDEDQYTEFMDQLGESLLKEVGVDEASKMMRSLDEAVQGDAGMEDIFENARH